MKSPFGPLTPNEFEKLRNMSAYDRDFEMKRLMKEKQKQKKKKK